MTIARFGPRFGLLLAWAAVDGAVAIYLRVYGANTLSTLLLLVGVVVFGLAAMAGPRRGADVLGLSILLLASHLAIAAVAPFRAEVPPPPELFRVFPLFGLGALVIGLVVRRRQPRSAVWTGALWLVIGAGLVYRGAIVATDIAPPFDVPLIQRAAGQALLHLSDPYLTFIYDSGYPYLPIAAVAAAAGELFGDARWGSVLGDVMSVAGIVLFTRRAGANPRLGLVLAGLWAWWAGGFYVAWQDFTEPILIGFLALGGAALVGLEPRSRTAGLLLGLAAATKQFGLGLLPFLPWRTASGRRTLLVAVATWIVVVVPFALWHAPEFAEGAFLSHMREPGRPYALNLLNPPGGASLDPPLWLVFPAALAFGWLCQRRHTAPVAAWAAGSAGLLLLAFELNRIAFVNYYAIPLALILLFILALDAGTRADAKPELAAMPDATPDP